jgi:hypothetical protein
MKIVTITAVLVIFNFIYHNMAESYIKDFLIIHINLKFLPFLILSLIEFYKRNKTHTLIVLLGCNIVLLAFSYFALDYINYPIIFFDVIMCLLLILLNKTSKNKIVRNPSC